jgi:hypothetical protein
VTEATGDRLGDIRVQVGRRALRWARPQRVVLGRRHRWEGPVSESFVPLADVAEMSARWFSVEDVVLAPAAPGSPAGAYGPAVAVRCESARSGVRVWDGAEPLRLAPGEVYLPRHRTFFVGDLVRGTVCGARVDLVPGLPAATPPAGRVRPGAGTEPPVPLPIPPAVRGVLLARYHRYYRQPPHFDPQPTPWADVAVVLGLLDAAEAADERAVRRVVTRLQDAVSALRAEIERRHPGWLPARSETQKSFHDHLRTILESEGLFEPRELAAFDAGYPRALAHGSTAAPG